MLKYQIIVLIYTNEVVEMHEEKLKLELKLWKTATTILAILFIAAIFTNGFTGFVVSTVEDPVPAEQIAEEPSNPESSGASDGAEALAKCLTEKEVIMYGVEWCGYCNNQKSAFGDAFQYVTFVDCDKDKKRCAEAGIRGYPTWVINGEASPGGKSLDQLASLAGCK